MRKTKEFFSIEQTYESRYSAYRKERNDEQKPENAKKTVVRFFLLIRPHAVAMTVVVLAAMASTVCNVLAPQYMGDVIDIIQKRLEARVATGVAFDFTATYEKLIWLASLYGAASIFLPTSV